MSFEGDAIKLAAAFGFNLFNEETGIELPLVDKEATYFDNTIRPTNEDCIYHCIDANRAYQILKDNPPQRDLDIIDWRITYLALNDLDFPAEMQYSIEVILFKQNFADSIGYFLQLAENAKEQ